MDFMAALLLLLNTTVNAYPLQKCRIIFMHQPIIQIVINGRQSANTSTTLEEKKRLLGVSLLCSCYLARASVINKNTTLTSMKMTKRICELSPSCSSASQLCRDQALCTSTSHSTSFLLTEHEISFLYCSSKSLLLAQLKSHNQKMEVFVNSGAKDFSNRKYIFQDSCCPSQKPKSSRNNLFGHIA